MLTISMALLMAACGGGGSNDGNDEQAQNSIPQTNLPLKADEKLLNTVNIEDIASEFTAATFGQESWVPRAVYVHQDILYIGDSYPVPQVLRYDLKTKKVLPKVVISQDNSLGYSVVWKDLTDIYLDDQYLYVANGVDQRVDIFTLKENKAEFVMSLGAGTSNVDQTTVGLTYPMGVIANKNYVFVADQQNQISVWKQSDILATNSRQAVKTARLSLPNCMKGCMTRLELIGDQLFAATNQGDSYVYDVKNLNNANLQNLVQPNKVQSNAATAFYLSATDQLMYAVQPTGRIQLFKQNDMLKAKQVLPEVQFDAVSRYRLANNNTYNLSKALDIASYSDVIFSLNEQKIVALPIRRLQQVKKNSTVEPVRLIESKTLEQKRVLQDGENWSVLTNSNERHVYMNQILSANFDRNSIRLKSYSAVPVRDLQIRAKLRQSDQWVVLAELDQLTPFSESSIPFTLNNNTWFNLVDGSGAIRLNGVDSFTEVPTNLFDEIRIDSETDEHVKKLNTIKAKWKLYFGKYDEPGKWCRITPAYAREWVIMMTNMAYMLSTPEFETLWFNHKAVMGHDFFGNAGKVNAANGFYTAADYQRVYHEILNRSEINLGVTNMGGGLGGGAVLGVDTWLFYGHYRLSGFRIIAHEFGHHWGGHGSAWAMEGHGFEAMVDWLNFYFQRRSGSLPYMDPNVNAFHLLSNSEVCQGINQNMVKGVASTAPWNKVDEYFKNNPLPTK